MNLFFDEDSQKLIIDAKKEMYDLNHPYVGSEHLMLAILKNDSLEITKKLNDYGIDYNGFRNELINIVGIGTKNNNWFLFTPLLKRIINNAMYYSKDVDKVVTPYHLFLSILQEGDGVANRILIGMNIDINLLYEKFLSTEIVDKKVDSPILNELGINMNKISLTGKYDPVIGRDEQIDQLIQVLLRKNKNNPLLVGEAGVGKTAIVEELARRIAIGNIPYKLKNKQIYSISMSSLVAGTKYRGEFEEKLNNLIKEVILNGNIILFIDEIHTLMGAGGAEGAIDASNILKPYLARGDLHVIGATTISEYNKLIVKDKALDRRFKKIYIDEANTDMIKNILFGIKKIYEKYHNVVLSKEVLLYILKISSTCIFSGRQPDKAIDLLDEVCSYVSLNKDITNKKILEYELKIKELEDNKNKEIINHNFKKALVYKDKEIKLRDEYNNKLFDNSINSKIKVNISDINSVIYNKYQIPQKINVLELSQKLKCIVKGQDAIIDDLIVSLSKYNFITNEKAVIYRLVGKSGVGKTFLVENVVKNIFSKQNFISLNMKEYLDGNAISKIIGSPPGYIGHENKCLFDSIINYPFSIILIDNMDNPKAYVAKYLLNAFKEGFIENSKGEKINLSKCIVFITTKSNETTMGFVNSKSGNNNYTYILNDVDRETTKL